MRMLLLSDLQVVIFCVLNAIMVIKCSVEQEMTVEVEPGREECFYQTVNAGQILDIEYQVIDGGQNNDMAINFRIVKPQGIPLVSDFKKADYSHRTAIEETGDYKICFDNTISRFSAKIVYFEIIVENDDEDENDSVDYLLPEGVTEGDTMDVKIEDIESALKIIKDKVTRSRHFQDQIRNHEHKDRSIAEHNFERVNFWSTVHMFILLFCGIVQVILVRSLFDEKSSLHHIWKKFC